VDVVQINSSVTDLRRWYKDGAGTDFTYDNDAEIDTTQYDNAGSLDPIGANKWVRSCCFTEGDRINWIYPVEVFNHVGDAIDADDPPMPTGLLGLPKTTAIVYKTGAANLPTAGGPQWIDVRPRLGLSSSGITWADIIGAGYVVGPASAQDHYLTVWDGVTGQLVQDGNVTSVSFGSGAAAAQTLNFVSGDIKYLAYNSALAKFQFSSNLDVLGDITLTGTVDGVDIATHAADGDAHHSSAQETHTVLVAVETEFTI